MSATQRLDLQGGAMDQQQFNGPAGSLSVTYLHRCDEYSGTLFHWSITNAEGRELETSRQGTTARSAQPKAVHRVPRHQTADQTPPRPTTPGQEPTGPAIPASLSIPTRNAGLSTSNCSAIS
jgi:hypothetical protein